mgnify:CR=1 FL=1
MLLSERLRIFPTPYLKTGSGAMALIGLLALCGCATTGAPTAQRDPAAHVSRTASVAQAQQARLTQGGRMTLGPATAAPYGFVELCIRSPIDCVLDAPQVSTASHWANAVLDGRQSADSAPDLAIHHATEALAVAVAPNSHFDSATTEYEAASATDTRGHETGVAIVRMNRALNPVSPGAAQARLPAPLQNGLLRFTAIAAADNSVAATTVLPTITPIPSGPSPVSEATLFPENTRELLSLLRTVNHAENRRIRSVPDAQKWGRVDLWIAPEGPDAIGDCEDYALAKRRALIDAGVPATALSIALVRTWRGEDHAVLVVSTQTEEYVLDNLIGDVRPWRKAPYIWLSRQSATNPLIWHSVTL